MTDQSLRRADELLSELVELVETARTLPMSTSCVVPRERLLDLLDELRETMPPEMDEARRTIANRDTLLHDAHADALQAREQGSAEAAALIAEAAARADELAHDAEVRVHEDPRSRTGGTRPAGLGDRHPPGGEPRRRGTPGRGEGVSRRAAGRGGPLRRPTARGCRAVRRGHPRRRGELRRQALPRRRGVRRPHPGRARRDPAALRGGGRAGPGGPRAAPRPRGRSGGPRRAVAPEFGVTARSRLS